MISLVDYNLIVNDVFYRCWHILDYIQTHPNMPPLEQEAIEATIMEALVSKGFIDPTKQSLDFKRLAIVDNLDYYCYEQHPRICGIPLWMKEKFRKKTLAITGGLPISLSLSRPPVKYGRRCVYDPNYAVSAIFDDATFIDAIYDSPTREGVRLIETRPFVEVNINGVNYLVDVLTKRILRSDWFKESYNMDIKHSITISECEPKDQKKYQNLTKECNQLGEMIVLLEPLLVFDVPQHAEYNYEIDKTKEYYPEAWEESERIKQEIAIHESLENYIFAKTKPKEEQQ